MDPEYRVEDTRRSYDTVAGEYAVRIAGELAGKPYDRDFLDRFAASVPDGPVVELGCGPGHVAAYLHARGVDVAGMDLSPAMVEQAQRLFPPIRFSIGDMLELPFADGSMAGTIAFYSIIHFDDTQLAVAFSEIRRVLLPGGSAAFAFHLGDETLRRDEWWGQPVRLDFRLLPLDHVASLLASAGLEAVSADQREPYAPEVEYQSRRAYLIAHRPLP